MEQIKLIWDFRGPDAVRTASHHEVHLQEFAKMKQLDPGLTGMQIINEMYALAWLVVKRENMIEVRDALKPHRGEVYQ